MQHVCTDVRNTSLLVETIVVHIGILVDESTLPCSPSEQYGSGQATHARHTHIMCIDRAIVSLVQCGWSGIRIPNLLNVEVQIRIHYRIEQVKCIDRPALNALKRRRLGLRGEHTICRGSILHPFPIYKRPLSRMSHC